MSNVGVRCVYEKTGGKCSRENILKFVTWFRSELLTVMHHKLLRNSMKWTSESREQIFWETTRALHKDNHKVTKSMIFFSYSVIRIPHKPHKCLQGTENIHYIHLNFTYRKGVLIPWHFTAVALQWFWPLLESGKTVTSNSRELDSQGFRRDPGLSRTYCFT